MSQNDSVCDEKKSVTFSNGENEFDNEEGFVHVQKPKPEGKLPSRNRRGSSTLSLEELEEGLYNNLRQHVGSDPEVSLSLLSPEEEVAPPRSSSRRRRGAFHNNFQSRTRAIERDNCIQTYDENNHEPRGLAASTEAAYLESPSQRRAKLIMDQGRKRLRRLRDIQEWKDSTADAYKDVQKRDLVFCDNRTTSAKEKHLARINAAHMALTFLQSNPSVPEEINMRNTYASETWSKLRAIPAPKTSYYGCAEGEFHQSFTSGGHNSCRRCDTNKEGLRYYKCEKCNVFLCGNCVESERLLKLYEDWLLGRIEGDCELDII